MRAIIGRPGLILDQEQREVARWYWAEHRTIGEIAGLLGCSWGGVRLKIMVLRAIFQSHGIDLPRFDRGRPRRMPDLATVGRN